MASIELFSPFSRAQCVQRLRDRVGDRFSEYQPVLGRIKETAFWLERRIAYRNSFGTRLRARLVEETKGTRIRCRTGMQPLVLGLMVVWFAGLTVGSVVVGSMAFMRPGGLSLSPATFVPLGMIGAGIAMVAFGRFLARDDEAFLIEFLCNGLNARKVQHPGAEQSLASQT